MASNDDNNIPIADLSADADLSPDAYRAPETDDAPEVLGDIAVPAKKAAAKRAPRKTAKTAKTAKKASKPQQAPADVPADAPSGVSADVPAGPADVPAGPADAPDVVMAAPVRKIAKRAPRKSTKKSAAAPPEQEPAEPQPAPVVETALVVEPSPVPEPAAVPVVPSFGLLFQAPETTEAPRRRRATAPAAAPDQDPIRQAPSQATPEKGQGGQEGDQEAGESDDSDDSGAEGAPRRRRRGGKGRRGRATGEGGGDGGAGDDGSGDSATGDAPSDTTSGETAGGDAADAASKSQPAADDDESGEPDESRRRTRRRRRGAAGEGDDQSGATTTTTNRVREPRPPRDEVTSVKGSTRLEAKKLRRREGREAGRRRTVITEAEFLARRESVERVMVVRHKQDRTQIGVLEDGVLVEHYVSRETNASLAGNVYLGRIQNVLPSMEAAFVDIGKGRNAVLYAGEVNWDAAGLDNRAKRIENALSSGQGVLVQVTKDPIGHKGARLTSQVSLPGRYLVYVPDGNMMGISRKLPDTERARLKKILREVVPENAGVIVRTAAEGASEDELRADVTRLTAAWEEIQAKSKTANAPALLHGEPDLTVRVIRDVFNEDFAKLVVSGEPAWETVSGYVNTVAPDLADRVQNWSGEQDLFTRYRVDEQIAKAMDRKVWLPSGGSLVIDRTEAMTVVDVNTGKFVGSGGNLEETVTKNNIEAAEEVVRQLRLRDIGGIIVIDFIDMVLESNRDLVVRRLLECLGRDRTKHQVAEVTSLGLVQMTRKRVGAGLIEVFSENCEHCNGRGIIVSADPIDQPAGNDGSSGANSGGGNSGGGNSGGGNSGGGNSGDSGDAGSGRGGRGRRSRGSGRDTGAAVAPAAEPKVIPAGPTPAQIAAAAHAAAIHAASQEPMAAPKETAASGVTAESEAAAESEVAANGNERPAERPASVPVDAGRPVRARRRASRSAKSPAISVMPTATPVVAPVVSPPVEPIAQAAPVAGSETTSGPVDQGAVITEVKAPAARARRKRPRVVAPAGPPRGAGESGTAGGGFGS